MFGNYRIRKLAVVTCLFSAVLFGLATRDFINKRYAASHAAVDGWIVSVEEVSSWRFPHKNAGIEFRPNASLPAVCHISTRFGIHDHNIQAGWSIPIVPNNGSCGRPVYPTYIDSVPQTLSAGVIFLILAAAFTLASIGNRRRERPLT